MRVEQSRAGRPSVRPAAGGGSWTVSTRGRGGSRKRSSAGSASHCRWTTSALARARAQAQHPAGRARRAAAPAGQRASDRRRAGARVEELADLDSPPARGPARREKRVVTSSTSAPARASAAQSARSYGGVYAGGSTIWTPHRRRFCRGADLLRRQHQRRRATCPPAWTAIRDTAPAGPRRTRCWCSTTPPTTARPRRSRRWNDGARRARRAAAADRARRSARGKAENDSLLLREARGELCLLLNEDSELRPGAIEALLAALEREPGGGRRRRPAARPRGRAPALRLAPPEPRRRRSPAHSSCTASLVTQSSGDQTREVGWVQSSAMLVRRDAAPQVGYLDPDFFVYSDETDLCKRLHDAGREILYVPGARAIHHEQLATDRGAGSAPGGRVPPRPRPLHAKAPRRCAGGRVGATAECPSPTCCARLPRSCCPDHDPRWYLLHARQALRPRTRRRPARGGRALQPRVLVAAHRAS